MSACFGSTVFSGGTTCLYPGAEEALYDSITMRQFSGARTDADIISDETSILNFRRLLEKHQRTERLLSEINSYLCERGLLLGKGTIVDATIINAPSSTKNAEKKRDPQMHQTRKGKQWYFGMKVHTGTDTDSGLVHTHGVKAEGFKPCADGRRDKADSSAG